MASMARLCAMATMSAMAAMAQWRNGHCLRAEPVLSYRVSLRAAHAYNALVRDGHGSRAEYKQLQTDHNEP